MKLGRMEAEQWAQEGVANLCEPYRQTAIAEINIEADGQVRMGDTSTREEPFVPVISKEEALACLRAAYAQGYMAALNDPEPTPDDVREAVDRAQILALMLPV